MNGHADMGEREKIRHKKRGEQRAWSAWDRQPHEFMGVETVRKGWLACLCSRAPHRPASETGTEVQTARGGNRT